MCCLLWFIGLIEFIGFIEFIVFHSLSASAFRLLPFAFCCFPILSLFEFFLPFPFGLLPFAFRLSPFSVCRVPSAFSLDPYTLHRIPYS